MPGVFPVFVKQNVILVSRNVKQLSFTNQVETHLWMYEQALWWPVWPLVQEVSPYTLTHVQQSSHTEHGYAWEFNKNYQEESHEYIPKSMNFNVHFTDRRMIINHCSDI